MQNILGSRTVTHIPLYNAGHTRAIATVEDGNSLFVSFGAQLYESGIVHCQDDSFLLSLWFSLYKEKRKAKRLHGGS